MPLAVGIITKIRPNLAPPSTGLIPTMATTSGVNLTYIYCSASMEKLKIKNAIKLTIIK